MSKKQESLCGSLAKRRNPDAVSSHAVAGESRLAIDSFPHRSGGVDAHAPEKPRGDTLSDLVDGVGQVSNSIIPADFARRPIPPAKPGASVRGAVFFRNGHRAGGASLH